MGDIRNKLAKIEGLRREKEALARADRWWSAMRTKTHVPSYCPDPHGGYLNLGAAGRAIVTIVCQRCFVIRVLRAHQITAQRPWARYASLGIPQKSFYCRRCRRPVEVVIQARHYIGPDLASSFWKGGRYTAAARCQCGLTNADAIGLALIVHADGRWGLYCARCIPPDARKELEEHAAATHRDGQNLERCIRMK